MSESRHCAPLYLQWRSLHIYIIVLDVRALSVRMDSRGLFEYAVPIDVFKASHPNHGHAGVSG